jgi:short-subunit dehydrogenase
MNEGAKTRKTSLVTGGTEGIGNAIARSRVLQGDEVFIVGRDPATGNRAAQELRTTSRHGRVDFLPADLSLMRDTARLADEVKTRLSLSVANTRLKP